MWTLILECSEMVLVWVQNRFTVVPTYHRLRNRFGLTRWYSKVTRLEWKPVLVCLEIVVILTQDRCMVCAEHSISSEIVFITPDGTPS
jgi:hypothetical protein